MRKISRDKKNRKGFLMYEYVVTIVEPLTRTYWNAKSTRVGAYLRVYSARHRIAIAIRSARRDATVLFLPQLGIPIYSLIEVNRSQRDVW